jgi:uncharacterized protein
MSNDTIQFHSCNDELLLEVREEGDQKREYIRGHGAVFYNPKDPGTEYQLGRRVRERVASTAFDGVLSRGDDVMALYNHDEDVLLARTRSGTLTLTKDDRGLAYAFGYDPADSDHKSLRSKMLRRDIFGSSFGFIAEAERFDDENDSIVRTLVSVRCRDVAPVCNPAYMAADSEIGRRKQEHFQRACFAYIGEHRDDAGVRLIEKRAATEFGWKVPTDFAPGKPRDWYVRQLHILELENKIRFGGL